MDNGWTEFTEMLYRLIPEHERNGKCEITKDTLLIEELGFDSLSMVELLDGIENVYGVDYTLLPDFLEHLETAGEIWQRIRLG